MTRTPPPTRSSQNRTEPAVPEPSLLGVGAATLDASIGVSRWVDVNDLDLESVVVRSQRISSPWVAQLCETPSQWPPILVTEALEVLDGHHRVEAARRLRQDRIEALVIPELGPAGALEAAVAANSSHGLPLSRPERTALVDRLLVTAGHWSDRRIASTVRVSPTTVGKRRRLLCVADQKSPGVHDGQPERRIGLDGKSYRIGGVQLDTPTTAHRWKGVVRRIRSILAKLRVAMTGICVARKRG